MFFERKRIIDELKGSLTGSPIYATNPWVQSVAVEENADEYITAGAKFSKINISSNDIEIYIKE